MMPLLGWIIEQPEPETFRTATLPPRAVDSLVLLQFDTDV
jgi:hypothetical protein